MTKEEEEKKSIQELLQFSVQSRYETSMFLLREEKSSDFSGEKKGRRKKSLQVQLHTRRTEVNKRFANIFALLSSIFFSPQIIHYILVQVLKCLNLKYFFFQLLYPIPSAPSLSTVTPLKISIEHGTFQEEY